MVLPELLDQMVQVEVVVHRELLELEELLVPMELLELLEQAD
jgi:hypothetical protein